MNKSAAIYKAIKYLHLIFYGMVCLRFFAKENLQPLDLFAFPGANNQVFIQIFTRK
jgi:hypothetical protein